MARLYEPYYGLREKPFSLSTDPRFFYRGPSHAAAVERIVADLSRRAGLIVVTGEAGIGKTIVCRSALHALERPAVSVSVSAPFGARDGLIKAVLAELGVVSADDVRRGRLHGASRAELSCLLSDFLRSRAAQDAHTVLMVDGAEHLSPPLLDEIGVLSDLEGADRRLQVILVGRPELSEALRPPHLREIRQRVTTHCVLRPLTRDAVRGYVDHRLSIAGAAADRVRFTDGAVDSVFEESAGVPRVVNRLCDWALQRGQLARAPVIDAGLLLAAVADLRSTRATASRPRTPPAAIGMVRQDAPPSRPPGGAPAAVSGPRAASVAALVVLGSISGLTLAMYWLWSSALMGAERSMPSVKRPAVRVGQPLPSVVSPPLDPVGDEIPSPADETVIVPFTATSVHPGRVPRSTPPPSSR